MPLIGLLATPLFSWAEDSTEGIAFFESRIRPVLVEKCYSCHSAEAEKIKGGLRVDSRELIRQGGDLGPAVSPSHPESSLLLTAIRYEDGDLEMPPKERLPESVIADFERWISIGAPDPRVETVEAKAAPSKIDLDEGRKHWSFQPIANPPVPRVESNWPKTDVDRFVLSKLDEQGLRPVPDASPISLLRRLYFDLIGLPPTAETVERFAAIPVSQVQDALAEERETLLASPEFGERWGRHWLDVARYADSSGGAHNLPYPVAFRYRDYVVQAFQQDKPYDQFLREQIAGDLLPAESEEQRNEQLTATGFLCVGVKDLRERDQHRYTMLIVEEQIDTVGRSLLGLTIACAKCHDHMFDPIPTEDYYALAGIFSSSEPQLGVRRNRHKDPLTTRLQILAGAPVSFSDQQMASMLEQEVNMVPIRLGIRDEKRRLLIDAGLLNSKEKEQEAFLEKQPTLLEMQKKLEIAEAEFEAVVSAYQSMLPHSTMAMRDRPNQEDIHDLRVHIRGDEKALGEKVPRGFPTVLTTESTPKIDPNQSGRLALADWIASPDNPLTARVFVNRVWQHLFGAGLVDTPDDFGNTGQTPSNPLLLDHLATKFIEDGWSVKSLIRYLTDSRIYHLSTQHDAEGWEVDPDNRYCWQMTRRRLDANALRDSLLQLSGTLKPGPPADPYVQPWVRDSRMKSIDRAAWLASANGYRSLYLPLWRDYIPDDLTVFDFPEPSLVTGKRDLTTVPTQALFLMNNPAVADCAEGAAQRIRQKVPESDKGFIEQAYLTILNRPVNAEEQSEALEFLRQFRATDSKAFSPEAALCQSLMASAEFRYLY